MSMPAIAPSAIVSVKEQYVIVEEVVGSGAELSFAATVSY